MVSTVRRLAPRLRQVADLLRSGVSAPEIAERLGVTRNVAETYVAAVRLHEQLRSAAARGEQIELSRRESQVAALLEEGITNREIGKRLGIGVRTVESHVVRLLQKQGRSSRKQVLLDRVPDSGLGALSFRELEVLHHIARGLSHDEVAQRLGIDKRTVESHALEIRKKLRVPGHKPLALYGMDSGAD